MKGYLTFQPGESIEWDNEQQAAEMAARLGDIARLEGCSTIFRQAWRCVVTLPGEGSPASGRAHTAASTATRHSSIHGGDDRGEALGA